MLHRMQDRGERIELLLKMNAQMLPDAPSRNVMAEIIGSEFPNEVIVLGGHIDSWDVGDGSSDDGAGCMAAMPSPMAAVRPSSTAVPPSRV